MAAHGSAEQTARSRWKALAIVAGALAVWLVLGLANPGTTYHFAPVIVAAGPIAARLDAEARLPGRVTLALGAVSTVAAVLGLLLLWVLGALDGPVVVGGSAPVETAIGVAVGAAAGLVIGLIPGKVHRRAAPPVPDQHS